MSDVMMFLEYRISMVFMLGYICAFLSLKYNKIKSALIIAGSFFITNMIERMILLEDISVRYNIFLLALEIVIVQMTAVILSSYRDMRSVFTGITASTYVLPGNVLYMGTAALFGPEVSAWLLLVPVGVHLLIFILMLCFLRKKYLEEMENSSRLWNELWVIPALFYAVTYMLTMWSTSFFVKWQNWAAIFMILILMEIIFVFIIRMISGFHAEEEIRSGREFLEIYAAGLEGQTEELKKMEENIRILRHDNKYRYQMIRNCLDQGELDKVRELLDQTEIEFRTVAKRRFCRNIVIDGAIAVYCDRAEDQQVEFQAKIQMPENTEQLNEFEFATVVMNLLDNASRSAARIPEKNKMKVWLRIKPVKSQLLLEVSNTFEGETCKISKITGLPISERGARHGFGMKSIKAYANKYHGIFQYSVENQKFCVRLLMGI